MLVTLASQEKVWPRRMAGVMAILGFTYQTLFATLHGALVVSILVYRYAPLWTGAESWGVAELALWFSELSDEVKASVGGSLVTILGFFIALQTAMASWKKQTAITLRMSAADNLDRLLADVTATMLRMQLFIESAAIEVSRIRHTAAALEDETILTVLSEDIPTFRQDRDRLNRLSQEFSNVIPRYNVLFMPLLGAEEVLAAIDEQIGSVLRAMWVPVPAGGTHPNHRRQLIDRADPAAYQKLAAACDNAQGEIAGLQGGLRGALTSAVIEMNVFAVRRTLRACFQRRKPEA